MVLVFEEPEQREQHHHGGHVLTDNPVCTTVKAGSLTTFNSCVVAAIIVALARPMASFLNLKRSCRDNPFQEAMSVRQGLAKEL